MDQDIEKKITDRMAELPEDVLQAITSSELGKKLRTIGTRHHLHIDQMDKLEDETMLVMLAFVEPSTFAANLAHQLNIAQAEADAIATEVANEIFTPIRHSMQAFAEGRVQDEHSTEPASLEATKKAMVPTPTTKNPAPLSTPPVLSKESTPSLHPADMMLSQKTVTIPLKTPDVSSPPPAKPTGYKADPYREPPVP